MQGSLELQPLPMNDLLRAGVEAPHPPVPALLLHLRPAQAAARVPVNIFVKLQLPPPTLAKNRNLVSAVTNRIQIHAWTHIFKNSNHI